MILTHDELETGELVPTWTSVDDSSVITFREVHEKMKEEGWVFDYHRTPVSSDRPIEVSKLQHMLSERLIRIWNAGQLLGCLRRSPA